MKIQPQAVKEALDGNERKLLKVLIWGIRRNPEQWSERQTNAMHWLQLLDTQKHAGLAPEDGAARTLLQATTGGCARDDLNGCNNWAMRR